MLTTLAQNNAVGMGIMLFMMMIIFVLAGMWKMFVKAGQPGWGVLIPFYNMYLQLKIVGRPGWWLILYFIPIVNFVVIIIVAVDLAKSFGKGAGFAIGLFFLSFIFIPILGFGSAEYQGPAAG